MTIDLQEFTHRILVTTEAISATLEPDGDWMPVLQWLSADNAYTVMSLEAGVVERDDVGTIIARKLREGRAVVAAFTAMGWGASYSAEEIERGVEHSARPIDRPDRIECVLVTVADDGEAKIYEAEVEREGEVSLGDWTELPEDARSDVAERMVEAIKENTT